MHQLIRLSCLAVALLPTLFLHAQQLNHVPGDLIVQVQNLRDGQTVKAWAAELNGPDGQNLDLEYTELISEYVGIHLLRFDYSQHNERELLNWLNRQPEVIHAQLNHLVRNRETIPDDPEFLNQWQYLNTGQGGGTPGADIDMELAWDFTTGGITANGDTIVACIVDDGIDPDHPDIAPNLWVNHAEVPGNGVDDDQNGYVDDYRGWSTSTNDDNVYVGGGHGTPVTGIIGAKGNDGFGVAGVNWDVKLMVVEGGTGVESEVLQAYSYPLELRKTYNESGGGKGAFVVVTNSSWGVDFGQPEDSPLWCAFYDSLGVQGILSCGATINGNQNVDEIGDLPTACGSDYLISVTNMNRDDVKVSGAGYGVETIDLGAFGQGTWTTAFGGGFGGFGGTSGATPHVAGVVALVYALECPDLMDLVATDPGAAALLVKDAIMEGVDPNPSLDTITVTGGRLNANNTAQLVLANCGACLPPFRSEALSETDTTATVSWTNRVEIDTIDLRWREAGSDEWVLAENVTSPYQLNDLTGCTTYEYQLQSTCDSLTSDFGRTRSFATEGCCENPGDIGLMVSNTDSMAVLFWSPVFAAQSYEVQLRNVEANTDWETFSTSQTNLMFNDLAGCAEYEYRFRLICASDSVAYTEPVTFFTVGCGPCTDMDFCSVVELSVEDEYIGEVRINDDFVWSSADGDNGYSDFTRSGPDLELTPFADHRIELSPAFVGPTFQEGWAVFIDLDQDGQFAADERVFRSEALSANPVDGTFFVPNTALRGYTRMRVVMLWNNIAPVGCGNIGQGYGEVEDYCVTISDAPACLSPSGLAQDTSAQFFTDSTAMLNWLGVEEEEFYTLRYRLLDGPDTAWTTVAVSGTEQLLAELEACATYEAQISTDCFTDYRSSFSPSVTFQTSCSVSVGAAPAGLNDWSVSPNPSSGQLTINYSFMERKDELFVTVTDLLGREVYRREMASIPEGSASYYLTDLPAGTYLVKLVAEDGRSEALKWVKR